MNALARRTALASTLLALAAPAGAGGPAPIIDATRVSAIVRTLADDTLEGRAPGTPGEAKTLDYLVAQFKATVAPSWQLGAWTADAVYPAASCPAP